MSLAAATRAFLPRVTPFSLRAVTLVRAAAVERVEMVAAAESITQKSLMKEPNMLVGEWSWEPAHEFGAVTRVYDPSWAVVTPLELMNKRNKLARKKKRKRMGERISLRYR
eukprot:GEMP01048872.1.p2 GENE.GEMP01048872.1~~GEMP01048872.1.p2  ORF type:complete len:111 (+),score=20.50 GEMP01048872.1:57-389(+)